MIKKLKYVRFNEHDEDTISAACSDYAAQFTQHVQEGYSKEQIMDVLVNLGYSSPDREEFINTIPTPVAEVSDAVAFKNLSQQGEQC